MKNLLKRLVREEQGQDVVEYALLAAGISVMAIPFVPGIGTWVGSAWGFIETQVTSVALTAPGA